MKSGGRRCYLHQVVMKGLSEEMEFELKSEGNEGERTATQFLEKEHFKAEVTVFHIVFMMLIIHSFPFLSMYTYTYFT